MNKPPGSILKILDDDGSVKERVELKDINWSQTTPMANPDDFSDSWWCATCRVMSPGAHDRCPLCSRGRSA